jgi:shikimate kinase
MRRLALVGPMGVGKTSVGRLVADQLGWEFVDLDEVLVRDSGRSIPEWFADQGERAFREYEATCLERVTGRAAVMDGGIVLATGGGVVIQPGNRALLREAWFTVYLCATLDVLISRLSSVRDGRPLLSGSDWPERLQSLLETREAAYREVAQAVVDVSRLDVWSAAAAVIAAWRHGHGSTAPASGGR